jgi:S1-C subfamily serine protease
VDGKDVTDPDVLRRTLADAAAGADLALTIQREGRTMDVKVVPRADPRMRLRSTT